MSGYDNSSFGPTDTITREQMAAMLYNYEVKFGAGGFTGAWMFRLPFTALTEISEWAYEGVAWCYMKDVITGKSTDLFDPKEKATRAEIAAILTQYLKLDERRINKPLKHTSALQPASAGCLCFLFSRPTALSRPERPEAAPALPLYTADRWRGPCPGPGGRPSRLMAGCRIASRRGDQTGDRVR